MSEQKPNHEVEGIVCIAPRHDFVEEHIWGRVPKHFCSIEGPQQHSDIILKWKKFGSAKTLLRDGRPAKLSNLGKRALVGEVTKNLMVLCGNGRTFQKDNHLCSTSQIRPLR